ncbi:MAG: hotdog fold thioesterase [Alphaproteobacteria bacterium TMED89]|nr:phenylacetic acid degradation protein PaaD [Rhodospirillaceae bacterium]RPH10716.1 MAG: hotdog fold thioesterase [Alphaproteobacteria bacterium TMED89]
MDAQKRAERSAELMWNEDQVSQNLGLVLESVGEGRSSLRLRAQAQHCNGHGSVHGGVLFMLADSASAFAGNSRNQRAVSLNNTITYLNPAKAGDTLRAVCEERALEGRNGIYDVEVRNQDGQIIVQFRGMTRLLGQTFFDEE